jgi:hypothetical protein
MRAKKPWGDVWNSAAAIPVSEVMSAILIGALDADATPIGTACMQAAVASAASTARVFLRPLRMGPPSSLAIQGNCFESRQTLWVAQFDVNGAGDSGVAMPPASVAIVRGRR